VHAWYPDLEDQVTVTLIEASNHILGTFDERLVSYVSSLFAKR
jgi:NADH dehydrogenase FAD-containing subunit